MKIDKDDFVQWLQKHKEESDRRYKSYLRADGIPKRGKAMAANASAEYSRAYQLAQEFVEMYVRENEI